MVKLIGRGRKAKTKLKYIHKCKYAFIYTPTDQPIDLLTVRLICGYKKVNKNKRKVEEKERE